ELDESLARSAARIMAGARGGVPLDALVVACAAREHSSGIVTSDGGGIAGLVRAADRPGLHVFAI
ncbi:MAG: hypothetical protein IAI50_16290, partial [Candidatus Eremiobacteraeota bacterium]|nr:hypothetical protein [Candidatus Eremiobacteraeota bacterium]